MPSNTSGPRVRRPLWTVLALAVLVALIVQRGAVPAAHASAPQPSIAIVPFAGDVFTPAANGSLIPVDPRSTSATAPLFSDEGNPLNRTWGNWLTGTAQATAHQDGGKQTIVQLTMKGLIPGGVYSIFYRTFGPDSNSPLCPNVEPTLALHSTDTSQQPDQSSFLADSTGSASFTGRVAGDLLAGHQQVLYSVIYHFDGHTYGDLANAAESMSVKNGTSPCRSSYGIDAMRQFVIIQK